MCNASCSVSCYVTLWPFSRRTLSITFFYLLADLLSLTCIFHTFHIRASVLSSHYMLKPFCFCLAALAVFVSFPYLSSLAVISDFLISSSYFYLAMFIFKAPFINTLLIEFWLFPLLQHNCLSHTFSDSGPLYFKYFLDSMHFHFSHNQYI